MSEEKKLDGKTLEGVSGGVLSQFEMGNCSHCSHFRNNTCPYGSTDNAIGELGRYARCPEKVDM